MVNNFNEQVGYIAHYEIDYKVEEVISDDFIPSVLVFSYNIEQNEDVESLFLDYSKSLETDILNIYNENLEFEVSKNISDMLNEFEEETKVDTNKQESFSVIDKSFEYSLSNTKASCWLCRSYKTVGGEITSNLCNSVVGFTVDTAVGISNRVAAKVGGIAGGVIVFGSWVVKGGYVMSCYIPPRKVCTSGQWSTTCPMTEL